VTLAMGHDSGPPGDNAIELVRMVEGGLPALEGIAAATHGSARALGLPDVGTVTAGAVADLLVLDGDPLADIQLLRDPARIWMVVQTGQVVAGQLSAGQISAGQVVAGRVVAGQPSTTISSPA
jgi:imidazolonepropionase-like amidohydrolase